MKHIYVKIYIDENSGAESGGGNIQYEQLNGNWV